VKKIISILVALGLVLGLTVMATPVSADVTTPTVSLDTYCAGTNATYTITFNVTCDLIVGTTQITVEFPAGTVIPPPGNFTLTVSNPGGGTAPVPKAWITVAGQSVTFYSSIHVVASNDPRVTLAFVKLTNPAAGDHTLKVNTSCPTDSTPVASVPYTIVPPISSYTFVMDFDPTYPGIAEGFIPPFKACGQNGTGQAFNTTEIGGKWFDQLDLCLVNTEVGCLPPCTNATVWVQLTSAPPGSITSLSIDGAMHTLTLPDPIPLSNSIATIATNITLTANITPGICWDALLHFDIPGDYALSFNLECLGSCPCPPCSTIVATTPFTFTVHQWKDAANITIDEKWNLISLPLVPFDTDIEDVLASCPGVVNLSSVWHYDRPDNEWLCYSPDGSQTSLATIEDGKSYWFRMDYPLPTTFTLWVWGTEMPEPKSGPAEYPVYLGWNMAGFTSMSNYLASTYLWNWSVVTPVVYGWTQGAWTTQGWNLVDVSTADLESGQGYWMAFPADGAIYVPTP